MKLEISLSPSGFFLHLPTGRKLEIAVGTREKVTCECCGETAAATVKPASLQMLQRVLHDAASGKRDQPGYIGEFPTQAVLDIWSKHFTAERKIKSAEERRQELLEKTGIDVKNVEFGL